MSRRQLAGKRILITGASEGIGRALALAAVKAGCRVLATARSNEHLETLAFEASAILGAGGSLEKVSADVTIPEHRQHLFDETRRLLGGLDILVNNAGVGASGQYLDLRPETMRAVFEVNLFAVAEMMRLFLPVLQLGVQPLIVNVSSILGRKGYPGLSVYCASKFAVQGLSDAVRAELSTTNVGILVVNPGPTDTDFIGHELERDPQRITQGKRMPVDKVAQAILRAIKADKAELTLTAVGKMLVLASRFTPRLFDYFVRRQLRKQLVAKAG